MTIEALIREELEHDYYAMETNPKVDKSILRLMECVIEDIQVNWRGFSTRNAVRRLNQKP